MEGISSTVVTLTVWALPVLFAITFHEAAHGFVANRLGDDTAKRAGRLTLNPLPHIDPVGTVLLPLVLLVFTNFAFGYARPVPVDARRLNNPRRDMIWVALAGPGMNLLLALGAALLLPFAFYLSGGQGSWTVNMLHVMIFFNCLIAVFNMLPVPPLDGGRVLEGLLPDALAVRYAGLERYGMFIIIGVLFLIPMMANAAGVAFNPALPLLLAPSQWLYDSLLGLLGIGG